MQVFWETDTLKRTSVCPRDLDKLENNTVTHPNLPTNGLIIYIRKMSVITRLKRSQLVLLSKLVCRPNVFILDLFSFVWRYLPIYNASYGINIPVLTACPRTDKPPKNGLIQIVRTADKSTCLKGYTVSNAFLYYDVLLCCCALIGQYARMKYLPDYFVIIVLSYRFLWLLLFDSFERGSSCKKRLYL